MKKAAVVKFVGNQENYKLTCSNSSYKYCRDCSKCECEQSPKYQFIFGHLYNAYFLEYWQGERTSLHVKGEDGEVSDFNPIEDFEIIEDCDNVLNTHEAIVRCNTHDYDEDLFELTYGHEYKAIGFDSNGMLLVMDECHDCYFYPRDVFEIIDDKWCVLDSSFTLPVYDWENTHIDQV